MYIRDRISLYVVTPVIVVGLHLSSVYRSLSFLHALLMARAFSLYSGLLTFFPCAFIFLLSSIKSSVSSECPLLLPDMFARYFLFVDFYSCRLISIISHS